MKKVLLGVLALAALLPLSAMAKRHHVAPTQGVIRAEIYKVEAGQERLVSSNTVTSLLGRPVPVNMRRQSTYPVKCIPADPQSGLDPDERFAMQELGMQFTLQERAGQAKIGLTHGKHREYGPCSGHIAWSDVSTMQTIVFKANRLSRTWFEIDGERYRIEILYRPIFE